MNDHETAAALDDEPESYETKMENVHLEGATALIKCLNDFMLEASDQFDGERDVQIVQGVLAKLVSSVVVNIAAQDPEMGTSIAYSVLHGALAAVMQGSQMRGFALAQVETEGEG